MDNKYVKFNQDKKQAEKFTILGVPLLIIGFLAVALGAEGSQIVYAIGFILIIAGAVIAIIGASKFQKVKKSFKVEILGNMFKEAIPDITYKPDYGLSSSEVYECDFLKHADRFHSEDFLGGSADGVNFVSSDVKLEERHVQHTKNGTRVYYVTYFLGRVFRFDFNKEFVGALQVLEAGSPRSRGYKKVKLESVAFNKKFKTFSNEEITAFYILTPPIMEAVMNLEKRHPGRIGINFHGDHMYVAINNNVDTFEVKMFKKIDDSMIEDFKKDLLVIKDFIVTLKLNKNLFKK